MFCNFMSKSNLHTPLFERELESRRLILGTDVNLVSAGVCALILDHDDNLFYARHAEKEGRYPNEAVGTSSETFRWVPARGLESNRATETPHEAWIRCLQEELGLDRRRFDKAGLTFALPSLLTSVSYINVAPEGAESLLSFNIVARVDNPEALIFDTQTSEEVLSTGFAPIEEIRELSPFRPGFLDWFIEAVQSYQSESGRYSESEGSTVVEWIEPDMLPKQRIDVKLRSSLIQ